MTDLYERRVEAVESASKTLNAYFAGFTPSQVVDLADYLLHGKQTSGSGQQTSEADFQESDLTPYLDQFNQAVTELVNQTLGGEIDLDALSIRILENLDLIGDASWHEEEDEPQPGDRGAHAGDPDFGEIRVFDDGAESVPVGTRITHYHSDYWEKMERGWRDAHGDVSGPMPCGEYGRVVLNPEILGTFRPVEHTPQPGDADFGEIRIFTEEEYDALPASVRVEYFGNYPHWEKREDGTWFSGNDTHDVWHSHELCDGDGRRVLNPEILGTFRPVEA